VKCFLLFLWLTSSLGLNNRKSPYDCLSRGSWIIEDGYFDNYGRTKTVLLCTESFTKAECVCLQEVLAKFNIKTSLKVRDLQKDTYRIRVSKLSMPLLRELVVTHKHPDFLYKPFHNVEDPILISPLDSALYQQRGNFLCLS
jgi:hypothetical protein